MPSSKGYKRDYKAEYANYQGKPAQIKNRSARNKAHAMAEAFYGKDIKSDVDHKKPLVKGGSNSRSNLRVVSKSENRSFARTRSARMK